MEKPAGEIPDLSSLSSKLDKGAQKAGKTHSLFQEYNNIWSLLDYNTPEPTYPTSHCDSPALFRSFYFNVQHLALFTTSFHLPPHQKRVIRVSFFMCIVSKSPDNQETGLK